MADSFAAIRPRSRTLPLRAASNRECIISPMRSAILLILLGTKLSVAAEFQAKFASEARSTPADGRLIVIVSKQLEGEPRFQVNWGIDTQQIFGMDVSEWQPRQVLHMGGAAAGNPLRSLRDLSS